MTCTKQMKPVVTWDSAWQDIGAGRSQPSTPTSYLQTGRRKPSLLAFSVPTLFPNLELTSDHFEQNWVIWNEKNIHPSCGR